MHKFLKILLLIIFIWALTLPWTLNYLSTISPMSGAEIGRHTGPVLDRDNEPLDQDNKLVIGVVACGEKPLTETIVLLKSIIISSVYFGIASLDLILFADDEHLYDLDLKVTNLRRAMKGKDIRFRYEIHPVIFPAKNHDEWKTLFKPCASQRLFLHAALPHISEILYLDVDTLVVGDLREVWSRFRRMSAEQAVGLVAEHEVSSIGWYNRFSQHPYYPPLGLNTGVMLMNLTRLRLSFDWEETLLNSYKKYKDKIVFGDQDLINIVFHQRPDAVYLLPCSMNYRPDHCMYGLNCKAAEDNKGSGIIILHGNRNVFHNDTQCPTFRKLYRYYEKFDLGSGNIIRDIVNPFKKEVSLKNNESQDKYTLNCDNIVHLFFKYVVR